MKKSSIDLAYYVSSKVFGKSENLFPKRFSEKLPKMPPKKAAFGAKKNYLFSFSFLVFSHC